MFPLCPVYPSWWRWRRLDQKVHFGTQEVGWLLYPGGALCQGGGLGLGGVGGGTGGVTLAQNSATTCGQGLTLLDSPEQLTGGAYGWDLDLRSTWQMAWVMGGRWR